MFLFFDFFEAWTHQQNIAAFIRAADEGVGPNNLAPLLESPVLCRTDPAASVRSPDGPETEQAGV